MVLLKKENEKKYKERDCEKCGLAYCPEECFNVHKGSMIALDKLLKQIEVEKGIKVHVVK